jgi:hypothetical protein
MPTEKTRVQLFEVLDAYFYRGNRPAAAEWADLGASYFNFQDDRIDALEADDTTQALWESIYGQGGLPALPAPRVGHDNNHIDQLINRLVTAPPWDVVVVETAADARGVALYTGRLVVTLGALAAGDGGGGLWYTDEASTWSDDTGLVLLPNGHTGVGRWMRLCNPADVLVDWFGVDGVADQAQWTAAGIAANLRGGGVVRGSPGKRYLFSEQAFPYSFVTYDGQGCVIDFDTTAPSWPYVFSPYPSGGPSGSLTNPHPFLVGLGYQDRAAAPNAFRPDGDQADYDFGQEYAELADGVAHRNGGHTITLSEAPTRIAPGFQVWIQFFWPTGASSSTRWTMGNRVRAVNGAELELEYAIPFDNTGVHADNEETPWLMAYPPDDPCGILTKTVWRNIRFEGKAINSYIQVPMSMECTIERCTFARDESYADGLGNNILRGTANRVVYNRFESIAMDWAFTLDQGNVGTLIEGNYIKVDEAVWGLHIAEASREFKVLNNIIEHKETPINAANISSSGLTGCSGYVISGNTVINPHGPIFLPMNQHPEQQRLTGAVINNRFLGKLTSTAASCILLRYLDSMDMVFDGNHVDLVVDDPGHVLIGQMSAINPRDNAARFVIANNSFHFRRSTDGVVNPIALARFNPTTPYSAAQLVVRDNLGIASFQTVDLYLHDLVFDTGTFAVTQQAGYDVVNFGGVGKPELTFSCFPGFNFDGYSNLIVFAFYVRDGAAVGDTFGLEHG